MLGDWGLERRLDDHRTGLTGELVGQASVALHPTAEGRAATYTEAGDLRFGSHVSSATRRLEIEALPDGSVLLRFADGRPFITLDLRKGESQGVHECGADRYELLTVVRGVNVIEERWQVSGPAKRYTARTTLTRL